MAVVVKVTNNGDSALRSTINRIDERFKSNPAFTTWVKFKCGGMTIDTSLRTVTTDSGKNTISGNLLSSFQYKKNGAGAANEFTVVIYYAPEYNDPINIIDDAIAGTLGRSEECTLTYGYDYGTNNLISDTFHGLVMDYNVEMQNNMLVYTFTGYSMASASSSAKIESIVSYENTNPFSIIREVFDDNKDNIKALKSYTLVFEDNCTQKCKNIDFEGMQDVEFFNFLDAILSNTRDDYTDIHIDNLNNISDSQIKLGHYYYVIDDVNHKIRFKRDELMPESIGVSYTFYWGSSGNNGCNLVDSFRTEFKGSIQLAVDSSTDSTVKYLDSNNSLVSINSSLGQDITGGDTGSRDVDNQTNEFAVGLQYSYTATLTTIGIPYDVKIGTYIEVVSMIYNSKHHTSGTYMVISTEDQLDANGYRTTWNLLKICGVNREIVYDTSSYKSIFLNYYYADHPLDLNVIAYRISDSVNALNDMLSGFIGNGNTPQDAESTPTDTQIAILETLIKQLP